MFMNNKKRSGLSTVPDISPIRIGFIGLSSGKGWAIKTHFPAIQQLSSQFHLVALYNTNTEENINTVNKLKLKHVKLFSDLVSFASYDQIDMIVMSIKVPSHWDVLMPLLEHSYKNIGLKYLFVEWCLASNINQAEAIFEKAKKRGIQTIISLQGRKSPYIIRAKELVTEGCIGDINCIEVSVNGGWYGYERPLKSPTYLYDLKSGVNLISNTFGHTIDILQYITSSYFTKINSLIFNNIPQQFLVDEYGKRINDKMAKTSPDHLLFQGILSHGNIPVSCSFKGGTPMKKFTKNLVIDIHGTKGDIKLEGDAGFVEMSNLVMYFCSIKHNNQLPTYNRHSNSDANETIEVYHLRNYNSLVGNILRIYESIADFHYKDNSDYYLDSDSNNVLSKPILDKQGFQFEGFPTFEDAIILHRLIDKVFKSNNEGKTLDVTDIID